MALLINAVEHPLCFYHCAGPREEEDQCHLACVLLAEVVECYVEHRYHVTSIKALV